jgi:hypothetical protein
MNAAHSVGEILAKLEEQIAFHREREAAAARQEAVYRDLRTAHGAELEVLTQNLAALKAAAATALELASRTVPGLPGLEPDPDRGRRLPLPRMVARVLESLPATVPFGAAKVAAELNRMYRERLRRQVKGRLVSIVLRRLLAAGKVRSVREGRPHHEALYLKAGT